jgi:CheY-like chemotaxis protein
LLHIDKHFAFDDSQNISLLMGSGKNYELLSKFQPLIIALSALITEQIFARCIDCGFDDVIESPLKIDQIQEKILSVLAKNEE